MAKNWKCLKGILKRRITWRQKNTGSGGVSLQTTQWWRQITQNNEAVLQKKSVSELGRAEAWIFKNNFETQKNFLLTDTDNQS